MPILLQPLQFIDNEVQLKFQPMGLDQQMCKTYPDALKFFVDTIIKQSP